MPDALEQRDIEALLKAVDQGAVALEAETAEAQQAVSLYDFRRPERVSKEHIRSLEGLHESFARSLAAALSAFLRAIVDVHVTSVEQCTYGEFILVLPNPTCFYLLGVEPMGENMILELGPEIVFPLLDRMLGGGREAPLIPERPVTDIERRLVDRVVDRAISALSDSWKAVEDLSLKVIQRETNPPMVQALPSTEVVVQVAFEITLGGSSGTMHLGIPFGVVEPLMNRLTKANRIEHPRKASGGENAGRIARILTQAPVGVVAYVAETSITVGDLMSLRVGDVIRTEKPASDTLLVTVEGRPKFRGRPAQHRGKKAILIVRRAGPNDRI